MPGVTVTPGRMIRRVLSILAILALVAIANLLLMRCERHDTDRAGPDAMYERGRGA